ncbi:flagellar biosynthesis protein FlhB [Enterovirga aerilata]|uniref:Flagellar biosynthetic protein FlhB n=1 Tax=Enterovirga aerilata TaxID=2730920 RepID=A0A849HVT0_9HYPH|nr:flagellar biosynthesis protein FlhB [Enterovirga sp. DB1703]NNM71646.1 flagellar biosynthesis protein FlhB [Enterovirga sp. DB1703]
MAEAADREDRTEEPTQKRLDDAIRRGDVAKSQEVSTFLALGAMTLALLLAGGWSGRALTLDLRHFLGNAHLVPDGPGAMLAAGRRALLVGLQAAALPVGFLMVAALAAGLLQHRPLWTVEPLKPKFERLSPGAGFKRIFGLQALGRFGKGLLKIAVVGVVAGVALWGERERLEALVTLEAADLVRVMTQVALRLLGLALAIYAVIAIGDYVVARFSWMRRLRMSKQELKDELKEQDGNPEIKAKLRQIRAQRLRRRMMAEVPKATVVVANPTHFAVALRYEAGQAAPVCVAKGVDELALRIRSVAEEHQVPVVENPPLARALHAAVEIDDEIPVEHYKAVAEVIGFVLRLKRRAS